MVDYKPMKRKEKDYVEFGGTLAFNHPKIQNTTLHYNTLTLHYTTLHDTTAYYTILHYTTLHYTQL